MKHIAILGSTGSIGTQTLEIVREQKDIKVHGISANSNIDLLEEQAMLFRPQLVAVMNIEKGLILQNKLKKLAPEVSVVFGMEGLIAVATMTEVEMVVTAVVGMIGLKPTVAAIKAGKNIALANKETLVTAGAMIMDLAKKHQVAIIPVDSEHSAIFQSLQGEVHKSIEKILLTASGGPFRGKGIEELQSIQVEDALKHPNWSMGHKITIDSATMMNKGLEVIEARWLFDIEAKDINVVVHPESIIHSMVQFTDGSVIGQLGLPDMKLPIGYALYYPDRRANQYKRLDLAELGQLTFERPNNEVFTCLNLAYKALAIGGTMATVLNAANEKAVALFLQRKIGFLDIPKIIEQVMDLHEVQVVDSVETIIRVEQWTHESVEEIIALIR